jgi:hypothetical protein
LLIGKVPQLPSQSLAIEARRPFFEQREVQRAFAERP